MSLFDKVVSAVTPLASDDARVQAHLEARALADPGDWLSRVLDHHERIQQGFEAVRNATDDATRRAAQRELAAVLTAHSVAEENVLYPALAQADEKAHATRAYAEQSAAKLHLGLLDYLSPTSPEYVDKLEHIRGAVLQHIYQEESEWFLELKEKASTVDELRLAERYEEEFDRYMGGAELPMARPDARPSQSRGAHGPV